MKIGIFLHPFGERAPAGLGRAIFEWTRALLSIDRENEYIIFVKRAPAFALNFPGNFRVEVLGGGVFWMDRARGRARADAYLFNTPVLPFFWRPPRALVIALDFAYCYPQFREHTFRERIRARMLKMYQRWSFVRADRIVAISQATKEDLVRLFGIHEKKIHVVRCGFKNICALPESPLAIPKIFFLFVGAFKKRKNVMGVARAYALMRSSHPDAHLLFAGRAEGTYADCVRSYIARNSMESSVHFLGHVSDAELSFLYKKALALVFPSFLEGFGFPVLEAMACGVPVIASRTSSLPELAGGAALFADPHDPQDIAAAMERISQSPSLRDELVRKGYERIRLFSWEKSARELLAVLKQLGP